MRKQDRKVLAVTCVSILSVGYWLVSTYPSRNTFEFDEAFRAFFNLYNVYRHQGLRRFVEEKDLLKAKIQNKFREELNDEEEIFATSVAVYLFPDVLPEDNFEKQIAMEQWAPLQEAIERRPHTPESRLWFEEMRASIWNYESPDLNRAKISQFAKEILRIYNEISSP